MVNMTTITTDCEDKVMGLFSKKETLCCILVDDGILEMNQATYKYIRKLQSEIKDLKLEKTKVEMELKAIKPVIESKKYTPAISKDCGECKFVVRSRYSDDIIGCRKSGVCDDFAPKESES
jgi:hypothetical protein